MDYVTCLRKFSRYKWYKPVLEVAITVVIWKLATILCAVISSLIVFVNGGNVGHMLDSLTSFYDSFDAYSLAGAVISLGSVAALIPAIAIATRIVKVRLFHTVASSCGGFSFKIFFKTMITAVIIIGIPVAIKVLLGVDTKGAIGFIVPGFVACIILGPLQCCGEKFLYRGLGIQTVGSWFRIPVIATAIQALLFGLTHPYGIYGKMQVVISGLVYGYLVFYTKGLEASCAAHIANNMILFLLNGFGFKTINSGGGDLKGVIRAAIIEGVYLAVVIFMDRKFNWFKRTPKESDIT